MALGLWLGTGSGSSLSDGHVRPSVSHAVMDVHAAVARPLAPDAPTLPVELIALTALVGVLIGTRRVAQPVRVRSERRQGRAPPGGPEHR
jgi:hypothetical protein